MNVVKIINVSRFYKSGLSIVKAVDNLSLDLNIADFSVVAGPSGSGKTTLLNLIGGLDKPCEGQVFIDGESTHNKNEAQLTDLRRDKIGFIFQAYNLLPVLTVYENIQLILQIQNIDEKLHKEKIFSILEDLGLKDLYKRMPSELSGGQQQRVAVARALINEPKLILADEPTANLDSESANKLMNLMQKLNHEKNVTFLFSSHDPMVIKKAKKVINIRDGKILE
ncbi:MAG: macrolide ABC transporter ATP-binding protein [Candidatus Cloacimonadota bacterium]|nr:MAG: macrolide ABC transporter ATP-binding protein [Candidatus Cloacimonadota bacterium]